MIFVHRDPVGVAASWFGARLLQSRRWVFQLGWLVVANSYLFPWFKRIPCAALNCHSCPSAVFACPVGTLQNFAVNHVVPLYTLGILGLIGLLIGRLSCGWFCPFGWLQDLAYKIQVPKWKISNRFGWMRYAVLIILVGIIPYLTLETWFSRLCPVGTLEAGIPLVLGDASIRQLIGGMFALKVTILILFLSG